MFFPISKEPQFQPFVLLSNVPGVKFHTTPTDAGTCFVYSGNSLTNIFKTSPKMEDFISIFDHKEGEPRNISGSGNHFRTTVWLDARDKASLRSGSQALKASPKPMILAVNEFSNFFNVRSSNVNLIPGMHTSLRIKQVQHVTTESFRALALGTRQCRLLDENPGKAHVVPLLQQEPLLSDQTFYF
jgi:hypothetical protein